MFVSQEERKKKEEEERKRREQAELDGEDDEEGDKTAIGERQVVLADANRPGGAPGPPPQDKQEGTPKEEKEQGPIPVKGESFLHLRIFEWPYANRPSFGLSA